MIESQHHQPASSTENPPLTPAEVEQQHHHHQQQLQHQHLQPHPPPPSHPSHPHVAPTGGAYAGRLHASPLMASPVRSQPPPICTNGCPLHCAAAHYAAYTNSQAQGDAIGGAPRRYYSTQPPASSSSACACGAHPPAHSSSSRSIDRRESPGPSSSKSVRPLGGVSRGSVVFGSSVGCRRRSHGVMTIGDIIDRLDLFESAKKRGLSKNRACAEIEISKGTVGTYQSRVSEAERYGLSLSDFREFKWRDFRQVFRTTVLNDIGDRQERRPGQHAPTADARAALQKKIDQENATRQSQMKPPPTTDALLDATIRQSLVLADHAIGPRILAKLQDALHPMRIHVPINQLADGRPAGDASLPSSASGRSRVDPRTRAKHQAKKRRKMETPSTSEDDTEHEEERNEEPDDEDEEDYSIQRKDVGGRSREDADGDAADDFDSSAEDAGHPNTRVDRRQSAVVASRTRARSAAIPDGFSGEAVHPPRAAAAGLQDANQADFSQRQRMEFAMATQPPPASSRLPAPIHHAGHLGYPPRSPLPQSLSHSMAGQYLMASQAQAPSAYGAGPPSYPLASVLPSSVAATSAYGSTPTGSYVPQYAMSLPMPPPHLAAQPPPPGSSPPPQAYWYQMVPPPSHSQAQSHSSLPSLPSASAASPYQHQPPATWMTPFAPHTVTPQPIPTATSTPTSATAYSQAMRSHAIGLAPMPLASGATAHPMSLVHSMPHAHLPHQWAMPTLQTTSSGSTGPSAHHNSPHTPIDQLVVYLQTPTPPGLLSPVASFGSNSNVNATPPDQPTHAPPKVEANH